MPHPALPPLSEWESFYVIVGSSAAALTGLMFVVIALRADARQTHGADAMRAFGSPTVVHFCGVLLLSALLSTPRHTLASLRACLLILSATGVLFAILVVRQVARQRSYEPELSDWIWHGALPILAYAVLLAAALGLPAAPEPCLDVVGAAALFLLFIGIHNAWDSAVYIAHELPKQEAPD